MKDKCFIKIIIPMYNQEKTIGRLLDSIISQTFEDFKVVVCDDCSSDRSCDVVEEYSKKDNRIFLSKLKEKRYAGGARNEGFRFPIDAQYTWFVDSDDYLPNRTTLSDIYRFIMENNGYKIYTIDAVQFNYDRMTMNAPWLRITRTDITVDDFTEYITVYDDIAQDFKQFNIVDDSEICHINRKCIFYSGSHHQKQSLKNMNIVFDDIPRDLTKDWQKQKLQGLKQLASTFDKNS